MGMTNYMMQIPPVSNPRTTTQMTDASSPANAADHKFKDGAVKGKGSGYDMSMEDFIMLIMAQYQNQDIMNPASTDDFVNQMVQFMTIQTMTNLNDISTISYAASLVGKEVTLGVAGKNGIDEIVGVVTGTGMLNGQQVIFVNGESYSLNSIMAIGRIPADDVSDPNDPDPGFSRPDEADHDSGQPPVEGGESTGDGEADVRDPDADTGTNTDHDPDGMQSEDGAVG